MVTGTHHEGNLRLFGSPPDWQVAYMDTLEGRTIVAETAFGLQFAADANGLIAVMDPESRSLVCTGLGMRGFLSEVQARPNNLIGQGFYRRCVAGLGRIGHDRHYAFIHERVLGGREEVSNVEVLDAAAHMDALAHLSLQVAAAGEGRRIREVR